MGLQKLGVLFIAVFSFVFLLFAFTNFSIIQVPFVSAGPNNSTGGGGGNGTGNQTHLACLNNTCSLVTGSGNNTCSPIGSFCGQPPQNQTHLACVNRLCTVVNGTGANQCSTLGVKCLNNTFATARLSPSTVECSGFLGFFRRLFGKC